ncbi:MAG: permease, partial [Verrucomicrobia bacterium]|nr:permease [Verrucomicrobiota bacterium]
MRAFSFNLGDFVFVWWGLLYETLPFLALGALLSGIVERCVSRETVARFFPRNRWLGIGVSALLGLVFPMCECGVVPVVRRLLLKGVPVSCGIAYLLASPIINPLVIASTMLAFRNTGGWAVAGLRVAGGFVVAVLVSVAVWKLLGEKNVLRNDRGPKTEDHNHERHGGVLRDVLSIAAGDFMLIGATLVVGGAIAALINSGFSRAAMEPFANNPLTAVSGMMGLAVAL